MKALVTPVDLSNDDLRRILQWAQQRGAEEINADERELAAHLMLAGGEVVAHTWTSKDLMDTRSARINKLRSRILRHRATFAKLLDVIEQNRTAQMEKDAAAIVSTVLANRRSEAVAEDERKTVTRVGKSM